MHENKFKKNENSFCFYGDLMTFIICQCIIKFEKKMNSITYSQNFTSYWVCIENVTYSIYILLLIM